MAAGLRFPVVHLPHAGTAVDAPSELGSGYACKSHLSKVSLHPSILKNPYKFLRFSRAKRAGGFAADLGRFGETTLPFFRSERTPYPSSAFSVNSVVKLLLFRQSQTPPPSTSRMPVAQTDQAVRLEAPE